MRPGQGLLDGLVISLADTKKDEADSFPQPRTFKFLKEEVTTSTKLQNKLLHRLSRRYPEWCVEVEPSLANYGYLPKRIAAGASRTEMVPSTGHKYHLTSLCPATVATCPEPTRWSEDKEFFEKEVKQGNYVRVDIAYDSKGKMIVGSTKRKPIQRPAEKPLEKMPDEPPLKKPDKKTTKKSGGK